MICLDVCELCYMILKSQLHNCSLFCVDTGFDEVTESLIITSIVLFSIVIIWAVYYSRQLAATLDEFLRYRKQLHHQVSYDRLLFFFATATAKIACHVYRLQPTVQSVINSK